MKKVLVYGMSNSLGGVSTFIYNVVRNTDRDEIHFDFIVTKRDKKNNNPYIEKLREFYGGDVKFYEMTKFKSNPFKTFKEALSIYKKNKECYDGIYMNSPEASTVFYILPFALKKHQKIIVHSHNSYSPFPWQNTLFRPILNYAADVRVACSNKAGSWLFGDKDFSVVNVGIDTDRFVYSDKYRNEIRERHGIDDKCLLIGNIGRLSKYKNQDFLLDIFSCMASKRENSKLLIIGDGELKDELHKKAEQKHINEKVIFVSKSLDVEKYYSAFDAFVMPSLFEGLPTVGIEAQCEGVPCFFSDTIDPQILITDRGFMVPLSASAEIWADEIVKKTERYKGTERGAYNELLKHKGYDIRDVARVINDILTRGEA